MRKHLVFRLALSQCSQRYNTQTSNKKLLQSECSNQHLISISSVQRVPEHAQCTHTYTTFNQSNSFQPDDMLLCDKSIDWCWSTGEFYFYDCLVLFRIKCVTRSMKEKSETKAKWWILSLNWFVWFDKAIAVNAHFKFDWRRQALKIKEAEKNCSDWIPLSIIAVADALGIDFYLKKKIRWKTGLVN